MQNDKTQTIREQIAKLVDEYAALALATEPFFPALPRFRLRASC